jgi:hypothetical protein
MKGGQGTGGTDERVSVRGLTLGANRARALTRLAGARHPLPHVGEGYGLPRQFGIPKDGQPQGPPLHARGCSSGCPRPASHLHVSRSSTLSHVWERVASPSEPGEAAGQVPPDNASPPVASPRRHPACPQPITPHAASVVRPGVTERRLPPSFTSLQAFLARPGFIVAAAPPQRSGGAKTTRRANAGR